MPVLLPLIGLFILIGGGVAYVASRPPAGSLTIEGAATFRGKKVLPDRVVKPKAATLVTGLTPSAQAKRFLENNEPTVLEYKGCKEWKWGFCVEDIIQTATKAQGAAVVARIMEWIGALTGLDAVTKILCLRFEYNLSRFTDRAGVNWYPFLEPTIPLSRYYTKAFWDEVRKQHPQPYSAELEKKGYRRVVFSPVDFGVDEAAMVYFIDGGVVWPLAKTYAIRLALQTDNLNISDIGSAQCKNGRWTVSTRKKAMKVFS